MKEEKRVEVECLWLWFHPRSLSLSPGKDSRHLCLCSFNLTLFLKPQWDLNIWGCNSVCLGLCLPGSLDSTASSFPVVPALHQSSHLEGK